MTKTTPPIDRICQALDLVDGKAGIGKGLFETISSLTPAISVELIIKNVDQKYNLLTWRDDGLYGPGWHVPGGVVRFKERLNSRVEKVLEEEIGVPALSINGPIDFHEVFNEKRDTRGHFICFVFKIIIAENPPTEMRAGEKLISQGQWRWFEACPKNLIENQKPLIRYLNEKF